MGGYSLVQQARATYLHKPADGNKPAQFIRWKVTDETIEAARRLGIPELVIPVPECEIDIVVDLLEKKISKRSTKSADKMWYELYCPTCDLVEATSVCALKGTKEPTTPPKQRCLCGADTFLVYRIKKSKLFKIDNNPDIIHARPTKPSDREAQVVGLTPEAEELLKAVSKG